jgi:hypothetical protein
MHSGPKNNSQHQRRIQSAEVKAVFEQNWGAGEESSYITKLYSDGKNIFESANQFIAHHRRLAPPCSLMQQKADIIPETNPGMKAAN